MVDDPDAEREDGPVAAGFGSLGMSLALTSTNSAGIPSGSGPGAGICIGPDSCRCSSTRGCGGRPPRDGSTDGDALALEGFAPAAPKKDALLRGWATKPWALKVNWAIRWPAGRLEVHECSTDAATSTSLATRKQNSPPEPAGCGASPPPSSFGLHAVSAAC
jgi:hypothetical protein